jgi:hypothetical protein
LTQQNNVSPARKRLALVQLRRKQALAEAQRATRDDSEITARVEALSMAAATAALAGAARASHHDSDPPTVGSQKTLTKAIVGALAGLAGLGALAKIIVEALK